MLRHKYDKYKYHNITLWKEYQYLYGIQSIYKGKRKSTHCILPTDSQDDQMYNQITFKYYLPPYSNIFYEWYLKSTREGETTCVPKRNSI